MRRWLVAGCAGLSLCLCALSASGDAFRYSYAPYSAISARRVETMRLTREGKYDAVEALLTPVQQAYERKEADEFAVATAFAPFSTSDPTLAKPLDAWVAKAPNSFSARLARARYLRQSYYRYGAAEGPGSDVAIGAERRRELAQRAITDYRAVLSMNPRLMIAYADLIEMAPATNDSPLLLDTYKKALEVAPATWAARDALLRIGAIPRDKFEGFLADAAKHEHENPMLLQLPADVVLGNAKRLWASGKLEQALAIYDAQMKSLDVFAYHKDRARILRVLGRLPESRVAIDRAIALMPGKYDGYRERGWLHIDTKHWADAVADFKRGLEIDPLEPELNRGLGSALEETGDIPGAIDAYTLSARWSPDAQVFTSIGWLQLHKLNNAKAAVAAMERAVSLDPKDKWVWYKHAEALDALGDSRARQSYTRYIALADASSAEDREFIAYAKKRAQPSARYSPQPPASPVR